MAIEIGAMLKSATTKIPLEDFAWLKRRSDTNKTTISETIRAIVKAYRMQTPEEAELSVAEIQWVCDEGNRILKERMHISKPSKRGLIKKIFGIFKK